MSFMLSEKSSSSVGVALALAAAGDVTVTRALASMVPPGPDAVRTKVIDAWGRTALLPLAGTVPIPEIEICSAFSVLQVNTADCPDCSSFGLAERVTTGLGAGG